MIRVFIGEPEASLRRYLGTFLNNVEGIQVVGEASTPEEALQTNEALSPNVVLVGFPLSSDREIEEVKRLRGLVRDGGLILLTRSQGTEDVFNAVLIGAAACIPKDTPGEFIVSTIQRVSQGEHPIQYTLLGNEELASYVLRWFRESGQLPHVTGSLSCPLSPREVEVVHHVALGFANKEIGARLQMSEQTVKNHLTAILRKTDTNDRAHAAVLSLQQGWISL